METSRDNDQPRKNQLTMTMKEANISNNLQCLSYSLIFHRKNKFSCRHHRSVPTSKPHRLQHHLLPSKNSLVSNKLTLENAKNILDSQKNSIFLVKN